MTKEELRKISLIQLEMMDQIHEICQSQNITYFMIAGTLLGAVRHKGFIPWDLDIDIAMPREDYERFREACAVHLKSPCAYLDYRSCRLYRRPHALISRTDTEVVTKHDALNPKLMDQGIYIDIFPLDNAPDDPVLRRKQAQKLLRIGKFKCYRIPYSYSYKRWKRYAHYLVSAALCWISVPAINQYQQKQMQKYNGSANTKYICSMASHYAYSKQCMEREIYGQPVLLEFEGREYYAPAKYKEYLTQLYGDYMQLPPLEKRQANLEAYVSVVFPKEVTEKDHSCSKS